ncbi:MAG TPA: hypothetical protein VJR29_11335 [bacterium]|nr:hypothetical protein [bacterium]
MKVPILNKIFLTSIFVGALAIPTAQVTVAAGRFTEPLWSIVVSAAPQNVQDVHLAGKGNNSDGWSGGGSAAVVGPLASCSQPGDSLTLLYTITEAGIYGEDGTPVPSGTYEFLSDYDRDGIPNLLTQTLGGADPFFYIMWQGYVVASNEPECFPAPVGATLNGMFTFPFPGEGRHLVNFGGWVDLGEGLAPLLNEGETMYNIRKIP